MKKLFSVFLSMAILVMAIGSAAANGKNPAGEIFSAVAEEMPVLPPQGFINKDHNEYAFWVTVGKRAAEEALALMKSQGVRPFGWNLIAMTNAGYAEFDGSTTMGSLDGLAHVTGVSRGSNRLLEIHSNSEKPLYFALFDSKSGLCAYLQVNPDFNIYSKKRKKSKSQLFSIMSVENIKAAGIFKDPGYYTEQFKKKIFGGNEFAIVTILNSVAAGAPTYAVRSFEFHDHYCPGVTSGILMAQFVKNNDLLKNSAGYFVQGIQPWCKEDALMVMLNTTPGKTGYAVTYPTDEDKAKWPEELKDAVNIIYGKKGDTWTGLVLGFTWGETGCPDYGDGTINRLCADLWYLDQMDYPEEFVTVIKEFTLPDNIQPKDLARPGVDPLMEVSKYIK